MTPLEQRIGGHGCDTYVSGMAIALTSSASDAADLWLWHFLYHSEHRWAQPWNGFLDLCVRREWRRLAAEATS